MSTLEDWLFNTGPTLRQSRQVAGLTQMELAARCVVDHSYLSQIEKGRKLPSLEMLRMLILKLAQPVKDEELARLKSELIQLRDFCDQPLGKAAGPKAIKRLSITIPVELDKLIKQMEDMK